jgi:Protein of unknown function (DUF551)
MHQYHRRRFEAKSITTNPTDHKPSGTQDEGGSMGKWRTIETLPMDGTRVLLTREGTDMYSAGYWGAGKFDYQRNQPEKLRNWSGGKPPTHWMPLPLPPERQPTDTNQQREE